MKNRGIAARRPVSIVMYHSVAREVDGHAVNPETFARQIRFLKRHHRIIPLSEVRDAVRGDRIGARKVALTFDGALLDFFEAAYPVLAEHKVPATVFVPTGFIGGHNDWESDLPGYRRKQLMDREQLHTLWQTGLVDFGSQTIHHARLSELPAEQLRRQVVESKASLEDILAIPVSMFSYPYGRLDHFSRETVAAVEEAGYEIAVTSHWGAWNAPGDLLRLRRIYFNDSDSDRVVGLKVMGLYDWRTAKERAGWAVRWMRKRLTPQPRHPARC